MEYSVFVIYVNTKSCYLFVYSLHFCHDTHNKIHFWLYFKFYPIHFYMNNITIIFHYSYSLIREVFLRYPKNHLVLNLYNVILQLGMDIRNNRFLMRCLKNVIMNDQLHLLAGNYGMCVGNYNYAVQNYIYLFRKLVNTIF